MKCLSKTFHNGWFSWLVGKRFEKSRRFSLFTTIRLQHFYFITKFCRLHKIQFLGRFFHGFSFGSNQFFHLLFSQIFQIGLSGSQFFFCNDRSIPNFLPKHYPSFCLALLGLYCSQDYKLSAFHGDNWCHR